MPLVTFGLGLFLPDTFRSFYEPPNDTLVHISHRCNSFIERKGLRAFPEFRINQLFIFHSVTLFFELFSGGRSTVNQDINTAEITVSFISNHRDSKTELFRFSHSVLAGL